MVLSQLLTGGIAIGLLSGYYFLQKEKKLFKLFESLREIPEFDFDYIGKLEDIPNEKPLALCADIDTEFTSIEQSVYNPKKKIIFSTVKRILPVEKKVTKQTLNDENESFDEFYNSIRNSNLPKMYLINSNQERIEVQWPEANEIGLFNVKPIIEKIDTLKKPIVETPLEKLLSFLPSRQKGTFGEIGLLSDEKYVYIGEVTKPSGKIGQPPIDLILKPQYILGDSKHYFLKYLDGQLIKTNRNGKNSFFVSMALMGVHFAFKMHKKSVEQSEMVK